MVSMGAFPRPKTDVDRAMAPVNEDTVKINNCHDHFRHAEHGEMSYSKILVVCMCVCYRNGGRTRLVTGNPILCTA